MEQRGGITDTPFMSFDEQAQSSWLVWRDDLKTNLIKEEGITDHYEAWLSKSERLVSGLALTFHMIGCVTGMRKPGDVSESDLGRAIDLWLVLKEHARQVFELNITGPIESAHLLLKRLKSLSPSFSLRDLKQKNWKNLRNEEVLGEALDWLCEYGYLKDLSQPNKTSGGRP